jgi:hypothetical protein
MGAGRSLASTRRLWLVGEAGCNVYISPVQMLCCRAAASPRPAQLRSLALGRRRHSAAASYGSRSPSLICRTNGGNAASHHEDHDETSRMVRGHAARGDRCPRAKAKRAAGRQWYRRRQGDRRTIRCSPRCGDHRRAGNAARRRHRSRRHVSYHSCSEWRARHCRAAHRLRRVNADRYHE